MIARAALALLLLSLPAFGERRAALLVGENRGDSSDAPLRYAESDAAALRDVLTRLGGVADPDAHLLRGADAGELRETLASLAERLRREAFGREDRLIVYVSSHAAEGELHLRGTRFPLAELRAALEALPVGLLVLVLDTCEAGAAVRRKGLLPLEGPVVRLERSVLTGRIVIASSGQAESAFESDALGGSLFTQHLVAGLRGAADASRDGKVTLQEAYAYAYTRTVDSAAAVRDGRQTPVFDMDLQGAGELVLTEPAASRARLSLQVERPGEWVLASLDGAAQVARFVKGPGPAVLALDPGSYRLRTRTGDSFAEEVVRLADGGEALVTEADLARWRLMPAGRKGSGSETSLVVGGLVSSGAVPGLGALAGFAVALQHRLDWPPGAPRPLFELSFSQTTGRPADGSFFERELCFAAAAGLEGRAGPVLLRAAVEGGALLVRQQGAHGGVVVGTEPRLDARAGAALRIASALVLDVSVAGGGLWVRAEKESRLQAFAAAQAGLGWVF